jgi:hypothetical protein
MVMQDIEKSFITIYQPQNLTENADTTNSLFQTGEEKLGYSSALLFSGLVD